MRPMHKHPKPIGTLYLATKLKLLSTAEIEHLIAKALGEAVGEA
jgi:hypothetical protein